MAKLSMTHHCVAINLKGYGRFEKEPGNYQHESVTDQLYHMFLQIGLGQFNLVTHKRGIVQTDFIVAKHPESVLKFGRGEQYLYHFNNKIVPQEAIVREAPCTGIMEDLKRFVILLYSFVAGFFPSDDIMARMFQEYSYGETGRAVPRYFNSSTFHQRWLCRRERLLDAWKCRVMILEGKESKSQPRDYKKSREHTPNAEDVNVRYINGSHFWTLEILESLEETTTAIQEKLDR
jgi:hypothetical protein